jgi:glycosyltransferase involved in cell wall biosynthesis
VWGNDVIRNASGFIALSQFEAQTYQKAGITPAKITIIPNGVDLSKFVNLPPKLSFKNKYSIRGDTKIILYLGRIHKSKGLDLLVDAFKAISQEISECVLVIVGPDGGYKKVLDKKIKTYCLKDKVIFTGLVSEYDKYAALIDADVFVTPKFYGFPITFAEACACGLPIVTTNGGDYLDWIDGKVGFSTNYHRESYVKALKRLIKKSTLREIYSNNCLILAHNKFNWNRISDILQKLYAGISGTIML